MITYPTTYVTEEAISLADAAGYSIEKIITQKNITRSKFGIGEGKAEEVSEIVKSTKVEFLIFDEVLKPTQQYNLAKLCGIDIVDRERLILEIFELRSSTEESRIQIKLAQLQYDSVRVKEKIRLAKRGEQPGFFGLGKYSTDISILNIKNRIAVLKKKLIREEKRKHIQRANRGKLRLPTLCLVGYTSSGKTTLFNMLTGESKVVNSGLFTTLTTYSRSITFSQGKAILSDTVGFISKLPAYMIDAFKSTLQELLLSSIILLVVDISQSLQLQERHLSSSIEVLNHLGISLGKVIFVLNKSDLIDHETALENKEKIRLFNENQEVVIVSAREGLNIELLKNVIESRIFQNSNGEF